MINNIGVNKGPNIINSINIPKVIYPTSNCMTAIPIKDEDNQ